MNIFSSSDTSSSTALLVEDRKPASRRGSLPFKKRRFPEFDLLSSRLSPNDHEDTAAADGSLKVNRRSSERDLQDVSSGAEQLAALSLLAVAAVSGNASAGSSQLVKKHVEYQQEDDENPGSYNTEEEASEHHGFSVDSSNEDEEEDMANSEDDDMPFNEAMVAAAADLQSLQGSGSANATSTTATDASNKGSSSNRAPLRKPLPNGCHGRTSRNNSYCRRHPCYNGSKYCKLHFQHYVVTGAATDQELRCGIIVEATPANNLASEGGSDMSAAGSVDGTVKDAAAGSQVGGAHHHSQDKRYTGCATEIRCKATTTRGRDCAYCAVNGTKYCYLHADYDTNPPPRRGGTGSTNNGGAKVKEGTAEGGGKSVLSEIPNGNAKAGKGKVEKRKSPSTSARRLSASKNIEKHMADAPYPLLSTLATDKWMRRKVIVSTGPLTNHVGLVEKWGNGWVSVRLPGVGLHNRRSFELYLHPDPEKDDATSSNARSSEKNDRRVEVFDTSMADGAKSGGRTRDEETASPPTPMITGKPVVDCSQIHEVTPLVGCRVIGIENGGEGSSRRVSNIMFPTYGDLTSPNTVPESPVPVQQDGPKLTLDSEVPLQSKLKAPVKSTDESNEGDIPLVRSLLLAQQDRAAKHKLGLLFGTACLERGRRNVHKPDRYEDTQLIGKKLKKRDVESLHGADGDGPSKRVCMEEAPNTGGVSVTPVSSASDEEESSETPVSMVSV